MNAALQCMIHTPPLVIHVVKGVDTGTRPAPCSSELFKLIKTSAENTSAGNASKPSELKYLMGKKYSQFSGMGQEDSIEFLHELLELTTKELNRVTRKIPYKELTQTEEPISVQVSPVV